MRKRCELCGGADARVHCESDQAILCWACDFNVHAANFLVEKHVRVLLCGSCSAPTPWKASGARLGAALTVCEACSRDREAGVGVLCGVERQRGVDHDEDEYDEDAEELEEEEDGENQVVPWALDLPLPPPADSSSTTGEAGEEFGDVCESRMEREHQITRADLVEPEFCRSCATSQRTLSKHSSRPAKRQRMIDESMQIISSKEQYLGEEEGSRMASRMVNLTNTLHGDAVVREAAAAAVAASVTLSSS